MLFWNFIFLGILINIGILGLVKNPVMQIVLFIIIIGGFSIIIIYGLNQELFGILLILVYIGAISVLFLFVVMMLNIRVIEVTSTLLGYLFTSLFYFLIILYHGYNFFSYKIYVSTQLYYSEIYYWTLTKISYLSYMFYNYQSIWILLISLILLIAMIGSILLTQKIVIRTKKQNPVKQNLTSGWYIIYLKKLCIY